MESEVATNRASADGARSWPRWFVLFGCVAVAAICVAWLLYFWLTPRIVGRSDGAQQAKALSDISSLVDQVQHYRLDVGEYPASLTDLLVKPAHIAKEWRGPYRDRPIPLDSWGNDYDYLLSSSGDSFSVTSYGRDGAPGGEGRDSDISLTGTANPR